MAKLMPIMLALKQVSFGYKANTPLSVNNVSLNLAQGSCTAILGP
ncbi:hypothetical protein ACOBV8_19900 (plasmid) [Pseudoalteromonas espejiana]